MTESDALGWRSIADLLGDHPDASVALIGAGLNDRDDQEDLREHGR